MNSVDNLFQDRQDAGRQLAQVLGRYKAVQDTIILALPRGGVVVGVELSLALGLPCNSPLSLHNVVTYDVVITVDNHDLDLKPGMIAIGAIPFPAD